MIQSSSSSLSRHRRLCRSIAYRREREYRRLLPGEPTIGSLVFFLSLFATNMTAFASSASSGAAYRQGIGIFGMMAPRQLRHSAHHLLTWSGSGR